MKKKRVIAFRFFSMQKVEGCTDNMSCAEKVRTEMISMRNNKKKKEYW